MMQIIIYAYTLTEPMKQWININCVRIFNTFCQLLGGAVIQKCSQNPVLWKTKPLENLYKDYLCKII